MSSPTFTAPPLLQPGDRVAVVAPAGILHRDEIEPSLALLRQRYEVMADIDGLTARWRYMAGDDQRRADELQRAIDDPSVNAIFAARGGYGCLRLIDRVNFNPLKQHPKWLIGYSDITVLHAQWARMGCQSVHGPNLEWLRTLDEPTRQRYFAVLEQTAPPTFDNLPSLHPGSARGPLMGGNLALLVAMLGSDAFPPLDGSILLLEDVNEKSYRIDRLLVQLKRAGVFERVAGVALGRFSKSAPDDDGTTIEQVLAEELAALGKPAVAGLPIGHDGDNVPLRMGSPVRLEATIPSRGSLSGE
ncbi:MAG: LD-carboxypeptidase [Phycisphaeraceae bacterium]|nr:LD-carboxypeptidase [Phycisphaeraceae bacterium]